MSDHRRHISEDKDGLSRYMRRVKTVLRKGPNAGSSVYTTESPGRSSKEVTSKPPPKPTKPKKAPTTVTHWGEIQQEKARSLFAKYGLPVKSDDDKKFPTDATVQRVVKPIRMRVHRTCHRCQTPYGPQKACVNCWHVRCTKCPRYPSKKEGKEDANKNDSADQKRKSKSSNSKDLLTMPSRTGGQDLVRKPIRQRVHRTCHRCKTTFEGQATECANCGHARCKKCPRDPPKLHKYPDGYPGDVDPPPEPLVRTWKKPTRKVRYICHVCSTVYKYGTQECAKCGQVKGPETIRDPPKKAKPELDPEVVRRVEERLAKLTIGKK